MRVATNLIWLPVADGGNANYVLVECCVKTTLECIHKLYYFKVSIENVLIVDF